MREAEARRVIATRAAVTRQRVTVAKGYILRNFQPDARQLLRGFLQKTGCQTLDRIKIVLHPTVDLEPLISQAAEAISWQTAFCEAIWGLMHDGLLIQASPSLMPIEFHIGWTTEVPGSGGSSGGWRFEEFEVWVPASLRIAPSHEDSTPQPLVDADLYLGDLDISDVHVEVAEALKDAVRCFRHELYVPCLAMLAKASEGAWIELGLSLLRLASSNTGLSAATIQKHRDELSSPFVSVAKKMQTVVQLYDRQDVFRPVKDHCNVSNSELKGAMVWSDVVRDSRNVVHYGVQPATANTYEKVAALLIGAAPHLQLVYRVRRAAEELADL